LVYPLPEAGEVSPERLRPGLETGELLLDLRRLIPGLPLQLPQDGFRVPPRAMDGEIEGVEVLAQLVEVLVNRAARERRASCKRQK
jgi:hypothetical protein